jgi:hypothetical protein
MNDVVRLTMAALHTRDGWVGQRAYSTLTLSSEAFIPVVVPFVGVPY